MAPKLKVAVVGASGETGNSIMNALLNDLDKFEVCALARPSSIDKPAFINYKQRGASVYPLGLSDKPSIVDAIKGFDVVISCMTLESYDEEMILIDAAAQAKINRYIPGFWGPVCPPRGVMEIRNKKEDLLDKIKSLYLPYTVFDVGWWYQLSLPRIPSGRIQAKFELSTDRINGDGNARIAYADKRDIGKYVAKAIVDPQTLNRMLFIYNEVTTQNDLWELLETASGEAIARDHMSEGEMSAIIARAGAQLTKEGYNRKVMMEFAMTQYKYSMGIRGDCTPEHAKYLGYLIAGDLYPDVQATSLKDFVEGMLRGNVELIYEGRYQE